MRMKVSLWLVGSQLHYESNLVFGYASHDEVLGYSPLDVGFLVLLSILRLTVYNGR